MPEFLLAALGILVLACDLALPDRLAARRNVMAATVTILGLVGIAVFSLVFLWSADETLYNGLYFIDRFSLLFKAVLIGSGLIVTLMSIEYVGRRIRNPGEYYGLLVFSVLGAVMMASAGELLTAYIALELLSFCLYVMVSISRGDSRSPEAGTKYILLGAISSAILLYGVSLIYSGLGSTFYAGMAIGFNGSLELTSIAGFVMLLVGLGFKLSIVPFHVWAPDVYEGAPTPVTAHIAVLSKAAATALVLRLLVQVVDPSVGPWQLTLAILAAATMTVGTITALLQSNIKRLLAYSSIAQIGFVLMAAIIITPESTNAVALHVIGYSVANFAVFMVVIAVENATGKEKIEDFAGLGSRAPLAAVVMTAALFSLAGLPFFAGFVTKFYLFVATANGGLMWLVIVGVLNSLISLYYYLRVIKEMYISEPEEEAALHVPKTTSGILAVLLIGIIFVGVYPAPILEMIQAATRSLG